MSFSKGGLVNSEFVVPHILILWFFFKTGTIGAVQEENGTGEIIPFSYKFFFSPYLLKREA